MATKKEESGDWIVQYSIKMPNGDLINLRGKDVVEFGEAMTSLEANLGQLEALRDKLMPKVQASVVSNRPVAAPAPVAQFPTQRAVDPTPVVAESPNGNVVQTAIEKVFEGKATGRMNQYNKPTFGPGTVVAVGGVKYDTFDKGLIQIAKQAQADGKTVNIMFYPDPKYVGRNKIVEDGLAIVE